MERLTVCHGSAYSARAHLYTAAPLHTVRQVAWLFVRGRRRAHARTLRTLAPTPTPLRVMDAKTMHADAYVMWV